jgi:hypothetical protein
VGVTYRVVVSFITGDSIFVLVLLYLVRISINACMVCVVVVDLMHECLYVGELLFLIRVNPSFKLCLFPKGRNDHASHAAFFVRQTHTTWCELLRRAAK